MNDLKYPAWLFFSLYETMVPQGKWNEEKERVASKVLLDLKKHLKSHDIENPIITEPNKFDDSKGYYQNPKV